jgi:hypothetical protein
VWASRWGGGIGSDSPRTLHTKRVTYLRLLYKNHGRPCRPPTTPLWKQLLKATAQHGRGTAWQVWINIDRLSLACWRPAQVRLIPATTRKFTKVVKTRKLLPFGMWLIYSYDEWNSSSYIIIHFYELSYSYNQSFFCCYHTFPSCILLLIVCGQQLSQVFKFRNTLSQIERKKS